MKENHQRSNQNEKRRHVRQETIRKHPEVI